MNKKKIEVFIRRAAMDSMDILSIKIRNRIFGKIGILDQYDYVYFPIPVEMVNRVWYPVGDIIVRGVKNIHE